MRVVKVGAVGHFFIAARRVAKCRPCTRVTFSELQKLSVAHYLSNRLAGSATNIYHMPLTAP